MEYDWKSFSFGKGNHATRDDGMCVMEAVAYVAGEEHSDHPECACPVLSAFCRDWNDSLESDAERSKWLGEFVWRLPGTRATLKIEKQRREMCLDWLVRVHTPAWLDLAGLTDHSQALRSLEPITLESIDEAVPTIKAARDAARAAAGDAARAAAWAAAGDAAWAAAGDAAWAAAGDAARAAAGDAAWAAAGDAAGDALEPTKEQLKQSAHDLFDRMIRLTEPQEIVPMVEKVRAD